MLTLSSLTNLDHNSPHVSFTYIIPQNHTSDNNFKLLIFYPHHCFTIQPWILTQNYMIFNCGVILTHYNYISLLVLTTRKMATWVAEMCRWSLCERIIFINPVHFLVILIHFLHLINPLNPELNPICYLLALLGAHHFLHFSRIRVKSLTLRLLMSYKYGAPILDVSRSHTTTQHSR